jgi:hypothetical protein
MWNKLSWLLYVRVRIRGTKPPCNILLPLSLFAPHQLMLAWGAPLALVPGAAGRRLRLAADTIHSMLLHLIRAQPQTIANINISDQEQSLRVIVRTVGFSGGEGV